MKTIKNIQTGQLNQFDRHFQGVEFQNQGSSDVLETFEQFDELSEEIEDIKNSPEFWVSEFIDHFNNYETRYVIAADGAATSSGKYVVAEIQDFSVIMQDTNDNPSLYLVSNDEFTREDAIEYLLSIELDDYEFIEFDEAVASNLGYKRSATFHKS